MAENRVIGRGNKLPWRLPNDMRHFMQTTMGKPVVMGRKTFASMKSPLPGRTNIVLTRDHTYAHDGARVVYDLQAALDMAEAQSLIDGQEEVMVIGGADIYAMALPLATRLYCTHVHADIEGDVFFPEFDWAPWQELAAERFDGDERHSAPYTIAFYERRS